MNIVLVGPPACGKGVLARNLKDTFNLTHIEAGDLLRARAKQNDAIGQDISATIARGDFVSEDLIFSMITERLEQDDCENGFILDGFPRTVSQAQSLDLYLKAHEKSLTHVFNLTAPEDELKRRMLIRASNPANAKRSDDDAKVFENRIKKYKALTLPVAKHYETQSLTRHIDAGISIPYTLDKARSYISLHR